MQEERVLSIVKRLLSTGIDIVYNQEAEAYQFDDEGDGYLTMYDEVIVTGKDLYVDKKLA